MTREVPAYEAAIFATKRNRFALVLPVLNEDGRLHAQLKRLAPFSEVDVVIADGGSTDGSVDESALRSAGVRARLIKTGPGRLGAQLRMAFDWCLKEGYEGVITMDGNNKDDPAAIPAFVEVLAGGMDHVQGSRYRPGGHEKRTPFLRRWGVRLLHAPLLSWAADFRYTDTTNGFRAYSRRFLEDPRVAVFRDALSGYELHYYLAVRAARLGFRVGELPVSREYPLGAVPTKISGWRGNWTVLKALVKTVKGDFDPS